MPVQLISILKVAHSLLSHYSGGYSNHFMSAEEFSNALLQVIESLEKHDETALDLVFLWFCPTSDWDDFSGNEGFTIGNEIFEIVKSYARMGKNF